MNNISQLVQKYPNFLKLGQDGVLEIYLDNQMLSDYRKCPGIFVERYLNNKRFKGGRAWSLEFGQYVHHCLDYYYKAHEENWAKQFQFDDKETIQDAVNFMAVCCYLWNKYDLDYFKDH